MSHACSNCSTWTNSYLVSMCAHGPFMLSVTCSGLPRSDGASRSRVLPKCLLANLINSVSLLPHYNKINKFLYQSSFSIATFTGSTPYYNAYFGRGTGPILLDDLVCSGFETRIINCPRLSSQGIGTYDSCLNGHGDDAGVRCVQRKPYCLL